MEAIMKNDKVKLKKIESIMEEERKSLEQSASEIDVQKTKYLEMESFLSAARAEVRELQEENAKLKEQVRYNTDVSILSSPSFLLSFCFS